MVDIIKRNPFGQTSVITDQPADSYEAEVKIITQDRKDTQRRRQEQRQREIEQEERKSIIPEWQVKDEILAKLNHYLRAKNLIKKMEYDNKQLLKNLKEYASIHGQTKYLQTLQSNIETVKPGTPQSFTDFPVYRLKKLKQ